MQSSKLPSERKISASSWKVVAILSSIATMVMYAETMLVPAIPDLIKDFNIPYSTSSWILTTYLITGAVMTPVAGKLSDIYGKKRVLLIIMIIYTVGVSIAGFSTNIDFMLIARGFQGVGLSMFPIAFSIVRAQFPREKMAIGQGIITSMYGGGAVIGLSIGGTIIQHYSWHATFFTLIPIAIALLFIIWRFIDVDKVEVEQTRKQQQMQQQQQQETEPIEKRNNFESIKRKRTIEKSSISSTSNTTIDVKGVITLAVAITSFLLVLTYLEIGSGDNNKNNSTGSSSSIPIASCLVAGIISLALFILIEKRSASPLFDFGLFLDNRILLATIMIMIVGFSMFIVFQTIPIIVENPKPVGFGGDPISASKVQLPFALVFLVFGPASGLIISKLGSMKPIIIGTVVGAFGFLGLVIFHSTEFLLSVNLAILSIGLSLYNVGAQNVIILSIPRQNSGASLGMTTFLRIVGSSIAPALSGMFMQGYQYTINIGAKPQSFPSSEAYDLIFLTAAILSIISISLGIVLIRITPPKCQNHLPEEKGAMDTVIIENIKQKILSWPGVTCNPYHFGGVEFRVNKRDMGHIHGEKLADLPFPIEIRKDLIASGKALPHIIYPESRWISYIIHNEEDAPKIVDLFRLQYERLIISK
ncbi:MAG TPA: MFS transporter [Nitrososphaeraceae archaeon]|nr:MFS transporter [Nitrososphaeraceae archaeon]